MSQLYDPLVGAPDETPARPKGPPCATCGHSKSWHDKDMGCMLAYWNGKRDGFCGCEAWRD